jgi:hypothetical protein
MLTLSNSFALTLIESKDVFPSWELEMVVMGHAETNYQIKLWWSCAVAEEGHGVGLG